MEANLKLFDDRIKQLGIIIDASHLSNKGFYDVAKLSPRPFVSCLTNLI